MPDPCPSPTGKRQGNQRRGRHIEQPRPVALVVVLHSEPPTGLRMGQWLQPIQCVDVCHRTPRCLKLTKRLEFESVRVCTLRAVNRGIWRSPLPFAQRPT